MNYDLLDLYSRASEWTLDKVKGGAQQLDSDTPCAKWDVRELMNHMLETQQYFVGSARGQQATPPGQTPPTTLLGDDPVKDFKKAREEMLSTYSDKDVLEKSGPTLGVAVADQLLHGWDLATATGQSTAMPKGLADAAYQMIHGRLTEDQRKGSFGPEVAVDADASAQDKLLAYSGRNPQP
jgi:uncharacterized protein (TIGR03086 family)